MELSQLFAEAREKAEGRLPRIAVSLHGDFVEYFYSDDRSYSEKLDEVITVHRSFIDNRITGIKLHGSVTAVKEMLEKQKSKEMNKKTVCVDLDGVLAQYDGWKGVDHIGDPIPGAQDFVKQLTEVADVVIFTTRTNEAVNKSSPTILAGLVIEWLKKHNFPFNVSVHTGQGKPLAAAYVDDQAVTCRPEDNEPQLSTGVYSFGVALGQVKHLLGE